MDDGRSPDLRHQLRRRLKLSRDRYLTSRQMIYHGDNGWKLEL